MANDNRKTNKLDITTQFKMVEKGLKDGVFTFTGPLTINELSRELKISGNSIISYFFKKGLMHSINHSLSEEEIAEVCMEFDFDFHKELEVSASNFMDEVIMTDDSKDLVKRPPVITVMGHVDHGKTTLIDKIRKSQITKKEAGGITQHTGAYQVKYNDEKITFLDTPGHEAFTSMRARGAKVTDIVILVVAADDGVMPQTKEAIDHAKSANVPMIVFVNKMDKQGADPERVKGDLSAIDVVAEDWGGDCPFVYGSALSGEGIDDLFANIILISEMLELKANPNRMAVGTVIESRLDKRKGTIATLIVKSGTLLKKDFLVAGKHYGRIRTMTDSWGKEIKSADPGSPVIITGLKYTPKAGSKFFAFKDEKFAKNLADEKAFKDKQSELKLKSAIKHVDGVKVLNIIIKSDVQGTAEAVKASLSKLENEEVKIHVISAAVGNITSSDVNLAQASGAAIFAFNVRPSSEVKLMAENSSVELHNFSIIYKMIEFVQGYVKSMMAPKFREKITGEAQILQVIFASKTGNIAGSSMVKGFITSNSLIRVMRKNELIHEGRVGTLQRGRDQAKKVENGKEFGVHIHKFNDVEVDDILIVYEMEQIVES